MTQSHEDLKDLSKVSDFQRQIGVTRIEAGEGQSAVFLDSGQGARNPKGDVHGGALAALCDIAMARAVRSANLDVWGLSTISMTINYMEPVAGDVVAKGLVVKDGKSTSFAKVEILRADGMVAIQGTGVFRKIRALAQGNETQRS